MSEIEVTEAAPKSRYSMKGDRIVRCEFYKNTEELFFLGESGNKYRCPIPGRFSANVHKQVKEWFKDEEFTRVQDVWKIEVSPWEGE